ncbi:MAG: ABC transporter permease [Methanomicrobiales archaeon]|nr:ABC transporter permease [Methanomicrobiales archaeon]
MDFSALTTIASKEFFDHLRSRKFLLIFGIFLVIAIIGMIAGIAQYNDNLQTYNENQGSTSSSPLRGFIAEKPSILSVFSNVATYLVFLGAILGIAMGFDLITKEKESKSLKILLSHPVYRDEVINGKAIGGVLALVFSLGVVLVLSLATLLVYGIVPDGGELVLIGIFGAISFLFIFSYFAIALFMSSISEESGSALIYTIIIFVVLSSLVPMLARDTVMEGIVGSPPAMSQQLIDQMRSAAPQGNESRMVRIAIDDTNPEWNKYNQQMQVYWDKRMAVEGTLALFSPTTNYERMVTTVTTTNDAVVNMRRGAGGFAVARAYGEQSGQNADPLGAIVNNLVALVLFPAVFFGLAYIRFMRLDVR